MTMNLEENYFRKELTVAYCQSEKMFIVGYHKSLSKAWQNFSLMTVQERASLLNFQMLRKSRSASTLEDKIKFF